MTGTSMFEDTARFETDGGVEVRRRVEPIDGQQAVQALQLALDSRRGALFTSGFEYPGRYSRWDLAFCDPPLSLEGAGRRFCVTALNQRGQVLLSACQEALEACAEVVAFERQGPALRGELATPSVDLTEEQRTHRPSLLSVARALCRFFASPEDRYLGLYGALGYDLVFAFDRLIMKRPRAAAQRDLVLYLPDSIVAVDHQRGQAHRLRYEFSFRGERTMDRAGGGAAVPYRAATEVRHARDHAEGEFADVVRRAREAFSRGDLFEVTPSQIFGYPCEDPPSRVMERLRERNPSPYGFFINLGASEYLVGASPEMYLRVNGRRVETCPIAGTCPRGEDAFGDAEAIRSLLASDKEEAELTMCTDVDRNDKARVCEPGSVRVIGRRQIELYSRLIHTVDHVEGQLRAGYDGFDAFLSHLWAVTVTGAPKLAAMQFIEDHERSPRRFYGGAVGVFGFDGHINTGLTLRTLRIDNGVAEVRAGATLLYDSEPEAEDAECALKASALLDALGAQSRGADSPASTPATDVTRRVGRGGGRSKRVLLVDHEDSFVHTLADYFRQAGATVTTLRHGFEHRRLDALEPDLVVLSPGPGRPGDFRIAQLLDGLLARGVSVFGVCLGLQAIAEFFGAPLRTLATPCHGKPSKVRVLGGRLLAEIPTEITVGRYHSLYASPGELPSVLQTTAQTLDAQVVMALEHRELPLSAVQFHPESILSARGGLGQALVQRVVQLA
ncbi:MAG: anthranilate synthase component I [Myxococcales bacterium]|nr:anthranilate synthase component I [Myxococcales bacterium]